MNKKVAVVVVALVVLGVGYVGWNSYTNGGKSANGRIEGSGTIEAAELNIGSQVAAEVTDVKVSEGSNAKKGQVLVVLDDRVLKDQVAVAKAGVDAAKAGVDDADTSNKRKIAQAQLDQAEASLSIAKTQQSYAVVKSPADGVVLSLPFLVGEMASPGATLATIGKISELDLTIYVDEKELGKVKVGQKASVSVDAYPSDEFTGKVSEIASEAEFTPQNVQTKEQRSNLVFGVTIKVDNPKEQLKPGMPADAVLD